jgi:hypothetical protein
MNISELQNKPKGYADEYCQIYCLFQTEKTSPAYAKKLLRILDTRGEFYIKRHGGDGLEGVKVPREVHTDKQITGYSGCKGFVVLIRSIDRILEEVSNWLGPPQLKKLGPIANKNKLCAGKSFIPIVSI